MITLVSPEENYLEKILSILDIYEDISSVKVILPTVAACIKLQHMIILKSSKEACFLPQIVPIINVGIGSEGIYNVPKEAVEPVSLLEQKILITKLILVEKSDITIAQGLTLANHIIRLFDELATYDVKLTNIDLAIPMNEAEHWQYMLEFLLRIHSKWYDIQANLQKTDMIGYRSSMLRMEIDSIKEGSNVVVGGIIPRGKLITELLRTAYDSSHSMLILPQMEITKIISEIPVTHKMRVLQLCQDFIPSTLEEKAKIKKRLGSSCIVTPTLFIEAQNIVAKIKEWVLVGAKKTAIITQNNDLINMISNILDIEKITHINIGGYMLSRTKQYEFFIMLIKAFDSEYILNLENTIILFKSPYLFAEDIIELEHEIRKKQISSDEEFEKWIGNAAALLPLLQELVNARQKLKLNKSSINLWLKLHVFLAEKLVPSLWEGEIGKIFSELLYDLLQIENLFECSLKDYIEFLEQTMSGARYFEHLSNQQVLFMNLEEASLGGYEYVICADMNEGSMPRSVPYDPWMNTQMRLSVGLPEMAENIGIDWNYFNNLLYRKQIFLTRSLKIGGKDTIPSRFWREITNNIGEGSWNSRNIENIDNVKTDITLNAYMEDLFPTKISATNVELLIRNPYGFYAKYILKLRKLANIFEQNNLASFGNFVHKTIEVYTNEYHPQIPDKYVFIMEIGNKIGNENYSKTKTNLWWPKFTAVMKAFIMFDEERRADGRKVFSEIYGEMPLTIDDKMVSITAIADRVEQDSRGNIYILDYKTGTLPTKQDIIRGISVQMIIEALIVESGGFKEINGRPHELTYVKITSREPYIETVTYKVEELDLPAHKAGLSKILAAAIIGEFPVNENVKFAPKYDDYKHLARVR